MVHTRERKTREEICEAIADDRDMNTSLSNTTKIYSDESRAEIIALLRKVAKKKRHEVSSEDLKRGLDEVETIVDLSQDLKKFIESLPIDRSKKDKFLELRKPLRKIMDVLEYDQMAHLKEHLPTYLFQTQMLKAIVESHVRGKPGNPGKALDRDMFNRILDVWVELTGAPPTYSNDDPRVGNTHKFLRMVLEPTNFKFTDTAVRAQIRRYRANSGRK